MYFNFTLHFVANEYLFKCLLNVIIIPDLTTSGSSFHLPTILCAVLQPGGVELWASVPLAWWFQWEDGMAQMVNILDDRCCCLGTLPHVDALDGANGYPTLDGLSPPLSTTFCVLACQDCCTRPLCHCSGTYYFTSLEVCYSVTLHVSLKWQESRVVGMPSSCLNDILSPGQSTKILKSLTLSRRPTNENSHMISCHPFSEGNSLFLGFVNVEGKAVEASLN